MSTMPHDFQGLTPAQKIELIGILWDSIESEHVPLTAVQEQELSVRLNQFYTDLPYAILWDRVKENVQKPLSS